MIINNDVAQFFDKKPTKNYQKQRFVYLHKKKTTGTNK